MKIKTLKIKVLEKKVIQKITGGLSSNYLIVPKLAVTIDAWAIVVD